MPSPANLLSLVLGLTVYSASVFGATLSKDSIFDDLGLGSLIMSNRECTGACRFPALTPKAGNLDSTQAGTYDYLVNVTQKVYGNTIVTKDADGSLQGPFNQLLYVPKVVQAWVDLNLASAGNLPAIENEAAVLGVLSVNKATYGIYAHTLLAQKAGFAIWQVKAMLAGITPLGITARQAAIYRLARKMAGLRGPLDSASFDAALSVLGRGSDGIEGVVQQVGTFILSALMLNVGDVCLPSSVK